MAQLCLSLLMVQTLAWIHAAGLSHCDLKPPINVLIDANSMTVVTDFKISCDDTHVASFVTTTVGPVAGTPPWMALKVLGCCSKGDMHTDMWVLSTMPADTLSLAHRLRLCSARSCCCDLHHSGKGHAHAGCACSTRHAELSHAVHGVRCPIN